MSDSDIHPAVYRPQDIMSLMSCSISTARKIIAQLNQELEAKGFCTMEARVSIAYFRARYHLPPLS